MRTEQKPRPGGTGDDAANTSDTRQAILDAARSRFMHYGFKKTTIDDIAVDAGVGKGTVYLYFDGKEDILLTLVRMVKRNITEHMRAISTSLATPEEKLRRMILAKIIAVHDACQTSAHGIELVDEMLQPRVMECGAEEHAAQTELIASVLREGVRKGDFLLGHEKYDQAAMNFGLAMMSFFPPYLNPCHAKVSCRFDLEARASAMLDFLFQGIRRQQGGS